VQGYDCDAGDADSVAAAFARVRDTLGDPAVLIYNAGSYAPGGILEIDPERFESAWRANCYGGFLAAREVLPAMLKAGAGTILYTGATAALRGGAGFAGLAVGKFGLRALAQSLAREFGPQGIHVAHVVIDGQIGTPAAHERQPERAEETFLAPEAIAENYWQLYRQPPNAWTQELDLRPHVEKF
jgi:NAD(P)-dependent dehydrogenase (short-subunit alcohol dehydrogenase family)